MSAASDPHISYIYVLGAECGPSKVGHSGMPKRRLKQLKHLVPEYTDRMTILGTWPVGARLALAVERYIHWLLRDRHVQGEWFDAPRAEIEAAIERALKVGVDPDHPMPRIDLMAKGMGSGEHISAKYPRGTGERIRACLVGDEHRAELLRTALDRELKRRERIKPGEKSGID